MQLAMSFATDQTAQLINTLWEYCQCLNCRMTRRLKGPGETSIGKAPLLSHTAICTRFLPKSLLASWNSATGSINLSLAEQFIFSADVYRNCFLQDKPIFLYILTFAMIYLHFNSSLPFRRASNINIFGNIKRDNSKVGTPQYHFPRKLMMKKILNKTIYFSSNISMQYKIFPVHLDSWISIDWMNYNKLNWINTHKNQKDMVNALSSYDRAKMQKQAIVIPTQNNFRKQHVIASSYMYSEFCLLCSSRVKAQ